MNKIQFFLITSINLLFAIAFFLSNNNAEVTEISGDLANIIPICKKLDNPDLFKNDLFLNDINNVKYYTPFYVETLRFVAKFTDLNYIRALNIVSLFTHFLYGMLWFYLLFLIKKDFILAVIFSIFMRGVIWPPGMELLGIGDLWTIMPRTIFSALIPLPFIIYKITNHKTYFAAIVLGLLVNFHPISGIGAVVVYLSLYFFNNYFSENAFSYQFYKNFLISILLILIGLIPYSLTYLNNVKTASVVNQMLFTEAIHARIDESFFNSISFLKNWSRPFTYLFSFAFALYYFADKSLKKINFKMVFFSILTLLVFCNILPFLENQVNHIFNLNIRIAFQLIRAQKLVIELLQISIFLLFVELAIYFKINNYLKIAVLCLYVFMLSISSASIFDNVPLIGDDVSRYLLPNNLNIYSRKIKNSKKLLQVFDFVNLNTPPNSIFYCENVYFRTATNRSEILDFHAASILIEGNAPAFVNAYVAALTFRKSNYDQKVAYLKLKKVKYVIDNKKWNSLALVFSNSDFYIYKL